jgi:hypothetical protein
VKEGTSLTADEEKSAGAQLGFSRSAGGGVSTAARPSPAVEREEEMDLEAAVVKERADPKMPRRRLQNMSCSISLRGIGAKFA